MSSTVHSALTFVIAQIICIGSMLYGYTVYSRTEKFWHFLLIGGASVIMSLLFVKLMYTLFEVKE